MTTPFNNLEELVKDRLEKIKAWLKTEEAETLYKKPARWEDRQEKINNTDLKEVADSLSIDDVRLYYFVEGEDGFLDSALCWVAHDDFWEAFDKVLNLEFVEQDGGGEGGSEYCHSVWKDPDTNTFYSINYSYYSYDGFDFYSTSLKDGKIVTPQEQTVIVYV